VLDRLVKLVIVIQIGLQPLPLAVLVEVVCLALVAAEALHWATNNPALLAQSVSSGPAQLAHSHPLTLAHHKEKTTCLQKLKMVW
jgi:hypothetical protein